MRARDRVGLNLPPIFLRIMLGAVFLWAGLAKVMSTAEVKGQDAADLARLGVISANQPASPAPAAPTGAPEAKPKTGSAAPMDPVVKLASQATPEPKAEDFPNPVKIKAMHMLTLGLVHAAHPGVDDKGAAKMPLWPSALAEKQWAIYMAWAATITELVGGGAVLIGLLTRFWSLGLAVVMLVALWLTHIGPAIQSGQAQLGFLPSYGTFDPQWTYFFFPFTLMCGAFALLFLGPGRLSVDNALFSSGRADDDDAG